MTKRQYILQHLLRLTSFLSSATTVKERQNIEKAIAFYAAELKAIDNHNRSEQFYQ